MAIFGILFFGVCAIINFWAGHKWAGVASVVFVILGFIILILPDHGSDHVTLTDKLTFT